MKEKIIEVLNNSDKALDIYDLQNAMDIHTVGDTSLLMTTLRELEDDTVIYHSNKDKYMMLEKSH